MIVKITVVIAEDHPMMRDGVRSAVLRTDAVVVGEAETGDETLQLCQEYRPDILLLDLNMPRTDPQEMLTLLPVLVPGTKVIVLTAYTDPSYIQMAQNAGVAGYVFKDEASRQLVTAIKTVASGATYFSAQVQELIPAQNGNKLAMADNDLSEREFDILKLLAYPRSNSEIAELLCISPNTVKYHLKNIYGKLNISSRQEAIRWSRTHNLFQTL